MAYLYQFRSRRRRSTSAPTSSGRHARPRPAAVARVDERAQLVAQLAGGRLGGERRELLLDVERRLTASRATRVACFEQLADLLVAVVRGGGRGWSGHSSGVGRHVEPALADLAIGLRARRDGVDRDRAGDRDDDDDEHHEGVLHPAMIARAAPSETCVEVRYSAGNGS